MRILRGVLVMVALLAGAVGGLNFLGAFSAAIDRLFKPSNHTWVPALYYLAIMVIAYLVMFLAAALVAKIDDHIQRRTGQACA